MLKPLHLGAFFSIAMFSQASAQPKIVYVDVGSCVAMEAEAERHDCYVSVGEQARTALPAAPDLVAPAASVAVRKDQQKSVEVTANNMSNHALRKTEEFGLQPPSALAQEITNARV